VRKSGFTIAPEAGTQRMRNVINKNLDEEQILTACRLAFEAGWDVIKLYFMIGLPTETEADVDGMVDLAHEILAVGRRAAGKRRRPTVTLSASSFIPKPETPFQWCGMERTENLYAKQDRIAARVRRGVRFKHHHCETSFLEGVFSRGDRALGNVLERAWRNGARFDGWAEWLNLGAWRGAFRDEGIDPEPYAHNDLDPQGRLPWQVVHSRVNRKWLALELKRALSEGTLSVCGPKDCHGCAPFARDCVKGVIAETTGRPLKSDLPICSTPAAPGPGEPVRAKDAPPRMPAPPWTGEPQVSVVEDRPRFRYRSRFSKTGRMRYLGHLDLTRLLLRALRRAGIRLVYSRGFNPKPRVGFSPALPMGVSSEAEYLDFETRDRLDTDQVLGQVNPVLPRGIRFDALREIPRQVPALGEAIQAARYRIQSDNGIDFPQAIDSFRRRSKVTVSRTRKNGTVQSFELAEEILELEPLGERVARMTLAMRSGRGSVRPEEATREIFGTAELSVTREDLLVDWNSRRVNPLGAAAAFDVH